jgi:hypothetical protein
MYSFYFLFIITSINAYSFCHRCIHFQKSVSQSVPKCNLLIKSPIFRDRQDVDLIGKEICTIKGKYFVDTNDTTIEHANEYDYMSL